MALSAGSVVPGCEVVYEHALAVRRASVSQGRDAPDPSSGLPTSRSVASGSIASGGGAFGLAIQVGDAVEAHPCHPLVECLAQLPVLCVWVSVMVPTLLGGGGRS